LRGKIRTTAAEEELTRKSMDFLRRYKINIMVQLLIHEEERMNGTRKKEDSKSDLIDRGDEGSC
jgi:hypothetical protein